MFRALIAAAVGLSPVAAQAQQAPQTVEQRLQKLEDESSIRRVIEDYAALLTARNFDGYVALFAEEGVWQNGASVHQGRDAIRAMLVGMFGETPAGYVNTESYMLVSNIRIDLDGDRASAHSRQLSIIRGSGGDPVPVLGGMYEDQFIREGGEWRILHRNDITLIPSPEEWARRMAEGIFTDR